MQDERPAVQLSTRVQFLTGVGPSRAERLARLGLRTARDLLFFFPRDYEHPAPPAAVDSLREGQPASLCGTITDAEIVSRTPGRSVFGAIVENESGAVRLLFFNQPFRAEQLQLDTRVLVSGNPKLSGLRMEFVHPKVTILGDDEAPTTGEILPVYPLTEGVQQRDLRRAVAGILQPLADQIREVMPPRIRMLAGDVLRTAGYEIGGALPDIATSLRSIHQPEDAPHLRAARTRLIFQELFVMQLALAVRRRRLTTDLQAPPLPPSPMIDARILNRFPFELTTDQRAAIREVSGDMGRQFPMNRLLQGDVGSGKTVVAIYAMMLAVAHQHQAVLMAPTEVLARQHHQTLIRTLADSQVRVGLLCGSLTAAQRQSVTEELASGEINLLVGTQALLYGGIEFHRLGLCVIDEQHKFGVGQRLALRGGGTDPHYLVMSATPIPRSVAMTMFGDVELSSLRQKPPGRGTVNTYLAHDGWRDRWWTFVREKLDEGRQAFVVAPRVSAAMASDDESAEEVASVKQVYDEVSTGALRGYRVGLLHGRMPNSEKQQVMQAFADGRLHVLVSTTVIEVGIDVPNATVMTIFGANRFGLAQLHQLRGRVSRSTHAGHVCVFADGEGSPQDNERLQVFEQTEDGFELAEADFRLRGPGDLFGSKQSGLPSLRIADLSRDELLLRVARELAQHLVDEDPDLSAEDLAALRDQMLRRYGDRLDLGDGA